MPGGGQGTGLCLTVPHYAGGDEVGVVQHRAEGVGQEYPSSPPSWMEPGVSGATWLGMPPGKENCLKSFCIPSRSWLMLG